MTCDPAVNLLEFRVRSVRGDTLANEGYGMNRVAVAIEDWGVIVPNEGVEGKPATIGLTME